MVKRIFCFILLLLCVCTTCFASSLDTQSQYSYKTLRGKVVEAGEVYEENISDMEFKYQDVKVLIKDQGYTTTKLIKYSISYYSDMKVTNDPLKVGDKVYVYTTFENGNIIDTEIAYKNNNSYLIAIALLYAAAIVIIGGWKGVKALISLILTILAIFLIIFPTIMNGLKTNTPVNPLFVTILTCVGITVVVLFIISGFNKKAIAAILRNIWWNNNCWFICYNFW